MIQRRPILLVLCLLLASGGRSAWADSDLDARLLDVEEHLERAVSEASFSRISVRLEDAQEHAIEAREAAERAAAIVRELRERYGRRRAEDQSTDLF